MSKVIGSIICTACCGLPEILGTLPGGEQVTINLELRDVVGREGALWVLDCGHKIIKTHWLSSQEWAEGFDSSSACFPEIAA